MEMQLKKYEKYSRHIKLMLMAAGIWPSPYRFFNLLAYVSLFSLAVGYIGITNFCLHTISNVMVVTKGVGLDISVLSSFMKIIIFLSHREDIVYLQDYLSTQFHYDLQNPNYQHLALLHLAPFANLFYVLVWTVGLTSFLTSIVIPFLALKHGKYMYPTPSIFPINDAPGSPIFWFIYVTETFMAFVVWVVTCGVDSAFGMFTLQMCGEFRILGSKFESLSSTPNYRSNFRECMQRHHMLMKVKNKLQRLFGFLAIWLAFTSAIIQCTLVFQITEVIKTMNPVKIGFLLCFIVLKLVQAFMYAWCGNLIAEESEMCLKSVYNADWPGSGDNKFMTDILVILSQKPLIFRAKSCMALKLEIFSKILNTSVSYFFLLQTLDEASESEH